MTSEGHPAPFRIPVTHAGRKGLVLLDQIRAVDTLRLARKLGGLTPKTIALTLLTLQELFAL